MISRKQEQQAEAIFMDAIALPPAERAQLFDERCGGDAALRAHLEELFALHDEATDFLETPPSVIGKLEMRYEDFAPERLEEAALPERIGQFTIKGVLGRGGMGVVYLAESDRPRRLVALKVIRPDAASRSLLRRFEHEAQVLALLQHPGIAHVYEAGVIEAGGQGGGGQGGARQPYFAMELVDGLPLTDYAMRHALGMRTRLALMARICDAVQHAHTKGIVHRDLKPGNILVMEGTSDQHEVGGQPKVLDFGVARLTDADVQVTTMQTDVGQLIGTIAYMSPEQVTGDPSGVDTRSDVYALGVILYELLTGDLPHRVRNVAITEALRTIREDDPTPLSSANRLLRGDVDTIVRKALEKDPERRYQTAADLGADLRRYLNNEPITARPPSTYYQLSKFARRNQALVGGVAAAFLMLVLGVIGTTWMAIEAVRNQQEAERNRQEAIAKSNSYARNSEFHEELLPRIAAAVAAGEGKTVLEVLEARAQALPLRYAGQPLERAVAERTIGTVYWVLDEFKPAMRHLRAAVASYEQFAEPTDRDYLRTLAVLSQATMEMGNLEEAGLVIERASRLAGALPASDQARLDVESVRANYLYATGRIADAEAVLRDLAGQQRALAEAGDDRAEVVLIQTIRDQARMVQKQGRLEDAAVLYRETLERRLNRPDMGPNDPDTLIAMDAIASLLRDVATPESFAEAERFLRQSHEGLTKTLGPDHFATVGVRRNLAMLLWARSKQASTVAEQRQADLAQAQQLLEQVLAQERERRGETHAHTLLALNNLVAVQFDRAQAIADPAEKAAHYGEAAATFKSIMEVRRRTLSPTHRDTLHAENNAARALLFQARALRAGGEMEAAVAALLKEAEALQRDVVLGAAETMGDNNWMTGHFEDRYAEILVELGRAQDAIEHSARAVRILEATYGADHARTKEARERLRQLPGPLEASRE